MAREEVNVKSALFPDRWMRIDPKLGNVLLLIERLHLENLYEPLLTFTQEL